MIWRLAILSVAFFLGLGAHPSLADTFYTLPTTTQQLILGRASGWDSSHATVNLFERVSGQPWQPVGPAFPVRLGRAGLAWGIGLHPSDLEGPVKVENDGRAPCGVFELGVAYGYAESVTRAPGRQYRKVGPRDLWVSDPASPDYNRHVVVGGLGELTPWQSQQRMKMDDPAHSLKLFIAHNAGSRIVPGAGSAIFFHLWREGGAKPSSGCTVMAEDRLKTIIAWAEPSQNPLFVLLPDAVYEKVNRIWGMP